MAVDTIERCCDGGDREPTKKSSKPTIIKHYFDIRWKHEETARALDRHYNPCDSDIRGDENGCSVSLLNSHGVIVYSLAQTPDMIARGTAERTWPPIRSRDISNPRASLRDSMRYWNSQMQVQQTAD
ncbi:MAG: hypothetical protein JSW08_00520 [archaeon]|nr:MAG: hypothetical protein JSW08_00520 [archaeon]